VSEPITVKLKNPITLGSQTIDEFTLRTPKAKDFRRLPMEPKIGDLLDLLGSLAGQPKPVIDELSVEDLGTLMEITGGFVPGGRGTGQTP
jgi:hypothetical protein